MTIKKAIGYTLVFAALAGMIYIFSTMTWIEMAATVIGSLSITAFCVLLGWLLKEEGREDDDDLS